MAAPGVPLDHLTRIIRVQWSRRSADYVVAEFTIFRRVFSEGANIYGPNRDVAALSAWQIGGGAGTVTDDAILQTLIAYSPSAPWPWLFQGTGFIPAPPPYDIDPGQHTGNIPGVTLTGVPSLPGVSNFGQGAACAFGMGSVDDNQTQGVGHYPGIRGRTQDSLVPAASVGAPAPFDGLTQWGSASLRVELYECFPEPFTSDPYAAGAVLASLDLNFGNVIVHANEGNFAAVAGAIYPRPEGYVKLTESGDTVQNSNNNVEIQILCRIPRPQQ